MLDDHVAVHDHARPYVAAVEVRRARFGEHDATPDVRVLERVDVDRGAPRVVREGTAAGDLAAVERRRVVGRHRGVVITVVALDALHPRDREALGEHRAEHAGDVCRDIPVDHELTVVDLPVEAPVRHPDDPQVVDRHGTTGSPGDTAHLLGECGVDGRDRGDERRRRRGARPERRARRTPCRGGHAHERSGPCPRPRAEDHRRHLLPTRCPPITPRQSIGSTNRFTRAGPSRWRVLTVAPPPADRVAPRWGAVALGSCAPPGCTSQRGR